MKTVGCQLPVGRYGIQLFFFVLKDLMVYRYMETKRYLCIQNQTK